MTNDLEVGARILAARQITRLVDSGYVEFRVGIFPAVSLVWQAMEWSCGERP